VNEMTFDKKRELLARLLRERITKQNASPRAQLETESPSGEAEPPLIPTRRDCDLDLSFGQEMLWFLEQLLPDARFYNIAERFAFEGHLDVESLRRSIEAVVNRHEVLRTTYADIDGRRLQRIGPPAFWTLRLVDLRGLPARERDVEARRIVTAEAKERFDLSTGPVLRTMLLQLADESYVLAIVVHHIAIDGWSLNIFKRELLEYYSAFTETRAPRLPDRPLQYADFASWERRWLTGKTLARLRAYWLGKLGPQPPKLQLPTDHPLQPIRSLEGATHHDVVESTVLARLREFCRREDITAFTALLAAFAVLMMRYSGQDDFVLGSYFAGRERPETRDTIGYFVNTTALRMNLADNPSFLEAIARTRDVVFGAHAHQGLPFHHLVEEINPQRALNSNPFADVFLNMLNMWNREEAVLANLRIRSLGGLDVHVAAYALTLFVTDRGPDLELSYVFSTDLFERTTIERMAGDFTKLLEAMVATPNARVGDVPLSPRAVGKESAEDLVRRLRSLGFHLTVQDGRLKINAPRDLVDDSIKTMIAARRDEIVVVVNGDGGEEGTDAGRSLRRISREPPLPLTSAQRRFWFTDKVGQGQSAYNIAFTVRLEGRVDVEMFAHAFERIFDRHEILKMRVGDRDDDPYPDIMPTPPPVRVVDLTAAPEESREEEALHLLRDQVRARFDLACGPIAGAMIVRIQSDICIGTIAMHHIVSDGWSCSILARELAAHYSALANGKTTELAPMPLQYIDYAAWEVEQVRTGRFEPQLAYWSKKLAGAPALLELPTDRPRPLVPSFRGRQLNCVINGDLMDRLDRFSKQHGLTLFMTVLAAFLVLLYRMSGQDDIVVGSPVSNRNRAELEPLVGLFVNSVVLRASLAGNPTFIEFLTQIRQTTIEALDNRDVAFELVVERLNPERRTDHTPIFQTMFALHDYKVEDLNLNGIKWSFIPPDTGAARFDLILDVYIQKGILRAVYEYSTDLFEHATIERMHGHLVRLLSGVIEDPNRHIREFRLLGSADEKLLLHDWNRTSVSFSRDLCVHALLERAANRTPDAVAVVAGPQVLTYRQLDERANQLAHLIRARGVPRGAVVAICVDRGAVMPIAMAAVLKAGAAYLPLDPAHPVERLHYILTDAQVSCIITVSQLSDLFLGVNAPLIIIDAAEAELASQDKTSPDVAVQPNDLVYVIYTSGSTGRPKGVQVEHCNLANFLQAMQLEPGFSASDVLLAVTTLSFDIAELEIWLPLSVGGKVVIATREDASNGECLSVLLDEHRITVMQATPATWRLLIGIGWCGKRDLKVLCGGEMLPRDLASSLLARVKELWNMYGPTETTVWSTASQIRDSSFITIGHAIANTRVYIAESSSQLAPIGVFGELLIAGAGVARGYWNRPDLTAEKFATITLPDGREERVYRTGDVVRFRGDGQLEFQGRVDDQIKLRGLRIELGEIEAVLAAHHAVKECAVTVVQDTDDQRLIAYVVEVVNEAFDPSAVMEFARAKLPAYMVPTQVVSLPSLPLTPNGKINRKALPIPALVENVDGDANANAIMTADERRVANIWRELLRNNRVGLHDNFFDAGGHSMLLIKLHGALQREFSCNLTLTELFQNTTIAAQARRIVSGTEPESALHRAQARARRQYNA
jgi:amino acid adenylation domain-containing protein